MKRVLQAALAVVEGAGFLVVTFFFANLSSGVASVQVGTWLTKASMLTARSSPVSGVIAGKLYIVSGGTGSPDSITTNEAYDPKSNAWRTLAPMPHGRHGTGAAVVGSSLYVAAGSLKPGSGEVTDQLIAFTMP